MAADLLFQRRCASSPATGDSGETVRFYDAFVEEQRRIGVNECIYGLFRKLKVLGLRSSSHVLELGYGICTLTGLLASVVKRGSITAVDISPASIAYARSKLNRPHVRFLVGDIVEYLHPGPQPDFVLLFDIIEHVPMERHQDLFNRVAAACGAHTRICVHIPSPSHLAYDHEHDPAALQLIDQPLPLDHLVAVFQRSGLELLRFSTYGIWMKDDYQVFVLRKHRPFRPDPLAAHRSWAAKLRHRWQMTWVHLRYGRP